MAAETLGIPYEKVRSTVADTASIGYNHVTGGSRVTYSTGLAVIEACKKVIDELRHRAALMWDIDVKDIVWEDGCAKVRDMSVGDFDPLTLAEIAAKRGKSVEELLG